MRRQNTRGDFAGKIALGSTGGSPKVYLTVDRSFKGTDMPVMRAPSAKDGICLLYEDREEGALHYLQMSSLQWVSVDRSLGWLVLTDDFAQAARFRIGNGGRELWSVDEQGEHRVDYTLGATPILTILGAQGAIRDFAPEQHTPSLAELRRQGGHGADLTHVEFVGSDLSGIDFTGANFTDAKLNGVDCSRAILKKANLERADLSGFCATDAVLDEADCTEAVLTATAWGSPASARRLNLSKCSAAKAVLGSSTTAIDCREAILTGGDFSDADLSGLDLRQAMLQNATLTRARLDAAILDDADLGSAILLEASLVEASLCAARAPGANLIRADLSRAKLTRAQLGSQSFLFHLSPSLAEALDQFPFPPTHLVDCNA